MQKFILFYTFFYYKYKRSEKSRNAFFEFERLEYMKNLNLQHFARIYIYIFDPAHVLSKMLVHPN